jgi:hypothetical protein
MNKKRECAIFQDLYELYKDEELEGETDHWMKMHEMTCNQCVNVTQKEEDIVPLAEDVKKIKSIRILMVLMYSFFIVISVWMSMWYFW